MGIETRSRGTAALLSFMRRAGDSAGRWIDTRETLTLGVVLAIACVLLLLNGISAPRERGGPDGLWYEELGRRTAASGNPFGCDNFDHAYWSPVWVTTIAGIYRLFGPRHITIRIFLVAVALATALVIHRVARRVAGPRAALAAVVLYLFSSLVFRFTTYYQYELPLGFLLLVSCGLLFTRGGRGDPEGNRLHGMSSAELLRSACAGILLGVASLISPRVLVVLVIAAAYFLLYARASYALRTLAAFALGILLVLTPWAIRNYRCYGEPIFTTTNGGLNFYIANNPYSTGDYYWPPREVLPDYRSFESAKWYAEGMRYIREHPLQTAGRCLEKAARFWNPHYGDQAIVLVAFIGGLVRLKRRSIGWRGAPDLFWLIMLPILFTGVHMMFYVQPRYFLPILPGVSIIAGIGVGGIRAPRPAGPRETA